MSTAPNNTWDRLLRAMRQTDPNNPDGLWALAISGSVNLAGGGGAGGTSMVDDNPFTPGGTSITPIGGYFGGRQVASGNAAAPALSGSAILQVHVVAGGAGGGLSQLQVVGSDNSNFNNVGYPSGGSPTFNSVPVLVMNQQAAGGGFATVGVYGSVSIAGLGGSIGAVNLGGSVGATQLGAPWSMVGSVGVTPLATFTIALDKIPTVNLGLGTVNIGNAVGIFGSVTGIATVNLGNIPTVNLGLGTVNVGNAHGIFGSVSILGSVNLGGQPISVIGSVGITGLGGSIGAVNLGGSVFAYADVRGITTPTVWPVAYAGSGYLAVAVASTAAGVRAKLNGAVLIATGTADITFQGPSGTYLTGSMRLLPGAGFVISPGGHWPWLIGPSNATLFIHGTGTQNIGGALQGYVE